ncbi:MAG: carboxypeptidase regulatory-like domain-containing protein [Gammaproteobacteria bacterium]
MKVFFSVFMIGATTMLFSPQTALAYAGGTVTKGGTISGTISFKGTPPAEPIIQVDKNIDYCGKTIPEDWYVVNKKDEVANAVVLLEDISSGKPIDKSAVVQWDNHKCMFDPHVAIAVAGQTLDIKNNDPILHNTHFHMMPSGRTLFNEPLPFKGLSINKKQPIAHPGVVKVTCDAHHWMLGYIYVNDNPYIDKTGDNGHFELTDVPPGTYTLKIWHEKFGEHEEKVTVTAGGKVTVNYSFSK